MRRRAFLATPALFLPGCGPTARDAWDEALAHMKETGRFGVVLITPGDREERLAFARRVFEEFERRSPALRNLLEEAVVIVVNRPDDRPMRILDPSGAEIDWALELRGDFAVTARALIAGRATRTTGAARTLPFGVTLETGQVPVDDPCGYCGLDGPYRRLDVAKFFKLLGD